MRGSATLLLVGCVAGIALIALIDYATGVDVRVFPLYFFVIAAAAWKGSRNAAIAMAVLSAMSWGVANMMVHERAISEYVWAINIIAQLSAFVLVAVLISTVRRQLTLEQDRSRTDPLTGLLNTRGFLDRAEFLFAIARRTGCAVTLAYIDLDNFKTVNDQHGHQAGDAALQVAVEVLRSTLRESDVVGRLGGDEFGALLLDATKMDAEQVLERVRAQLAVAMNGRDWPITASVGAITFGSAPASLDHALRAADQVMYSVKRAGKNRVRVEVAKPDSAAATVVP
ncbi:MAG: GGDEF domain-containing protein [Deltaproteobacteria bacterium]|nr:GGDEF domain-containing protein [Deltaproteobacteria bacterium]